MAAQTRLGIWKMQSSNTMSNMAQEVLCKRKTPADNRAKTMVVVLHGYNPPNPLYIHWWGVTNRYNWLAQRHNVVVLEPHGRGNASYRGIGDADVVRAIALAKQKFSIDADRS